LNGESQTGAAQDLNGAKKNIHSAQLSVAEWPILAMPATSLAYLPLDTCHCDTASIKFKFALYL